MESDLIVIGGGVMGLSTAWAALRSGASVTLVDPLPRANDHNASNDESKVFRLAYGGEEEYTRMARAALALWTELEAETGRRVLHRTGCLLLGVPRGLAQATHDTLVRLGLASEWLPASDVAQRYPAFAGVPYAVVDPAGGWLDPPEVLAALEETAIKRGLDLQRGSRAVDVAEPGGRVEVTLADGRRLAARAAVVTAGFQAPELLPFLAPSIRVSRQVELFFEAPRALPRFPVFLALDENHYGFPETGGAVKVADHSKGPIVTDFSVRPPPTADEVDSVRAWLGRRIPALAHARLLRHRICLYDNAPGDRFLLERAPGRRNVVVGAGFSGHGYKFAPEIGRRLAALALGSAPLIP